jgi:hypothetical protein
LDGLTLRPRLYGETTNRPQLLALAAKQLATDHIPTTALAIMAGDRIAVEAPGYSEIFDFLGTSGLVAVSHQESAAIRVTISTLQPDDAVRLAADIACCLRPDRRTHSM